MAYLFRVLECSVSNVSISSTIFNMDIEYVYVFIYVLDMDYFFTVPT